jgi:hypothetical protein
VVGTWSARGLQPFEPLRHGDEAALEAELADVARFASERSS